MKERSYDGGADRCSHSRHRRDAKYQEEQDPDGRVSDSSDRDQRDQQAKEGCDTLSAPELQPDRIEVPDKCASRCCSAAFRSNPVLGDENRRRRLEAVEEEGQCREELASRP